MNRFEIYLPHSLEELLNDELFISFVNKRSTDSALQFEWESILAAHAEKQSNFQEAADIINVSAGVSLPMFSESREKVWGAIADNINQPSLKTSYKWWRVAAIIVVMLSLAGISLWNTPDVPAIVNWQTLPGQSKLITLPDGSIVTLQENSIISFKENWTTDEVREVWIDGQAHFDVTHLNVDTLTIKIAEKFVVHVGVNMNVTVLGTIFNVKSAVLESSVELEYGSIKVGFTDKNVTESILLKPGEKLEYKEKTKTFVKMKSAVNSSSDNKSGEAMQLKNTSVKEIIAMVEQTYQKKIMVSDSTILNRKLDGSFPIFSEIDVWFILSNILDIDVVIINDDVLEFRPRN